MFPSPLLATIRLSRPVRAEGTTMAEVGSTPPLEIVCVDVSPPPIPEMSVTLLDPELTVATSRPGPPVNCPTKSAVGLVPTE